MEQQSPSSVVEVGAVVQVQTEETAEEFACLQTELNTASATIHTLQEKVDRTTPITNLRLEGEITKIRIGGRI